MTVEKWLDPEKVEYLREKDGKLFYELQQREACDRLKVLTQMGLHPNVLRDFKQNATLNYSERSQIGKSAVGILYYVDEDHYAQPIRSFNKKYGGVVFHATFENTEFGKLLDLHHVSNSPSEWSRERSDLFCGISFAYVVNLDVGWCSEFGSVEITTSGGGLLRTA